MNKRYHFSFFSGCRLLLALLCLAGALQVSADTVTVDVTEGGVVLGDGFSSGVIDCQFPGGPVCSYENFNEFEGSDELVTLVASSFFGWESLQTDSPYLQEKAIDIYQLGEMRNGMVLL